MKRLVILLIMSWLVIPFAALADGPDDQYVSIYTLIQVGDSLAAQGKPAAALARYVEAQTALTRLETANPSWNVNLVHYRLKYLAAKIAQATAAQAEAPAPPPAAPTPANPSAAIVSPASPPTTAPANETAVTPAIIPPPPSAEIVAQMRQLQEKIERLESDKALVEAKLKEALAARPAAVDPQEFARAQEQVKDLQKENELLKTSLAEAKTNLAPAAASRETLRESLAEANRKVAELTQANAALAAEKLALKEQVKNAAAPDATTLALRDENALLKKQLAELKSRGAVAAPSDATALKLQEAQAQIAALQSDKEILRLEKIALETRMKETKPVILATTSRVPGLPDLATAPTEATNSPVAVATNSAPADTAAAPALDSVTASRIAQLEAQRDELEKSLAIATHDIAGRKKGKEMASHIDEMTRQLGALRARLEVLESRQVPYTPDELAMLGKPDTVLLTASAHLPGRKQPRELPASAAVLLAEARRYFVAHELDKAEEKYQEVLKMDDKNVATLADLASIQVEEGRGDEAEKNLKTALALEPDDDYSLYVLGQLKFEQKKYDEAFDCLSRAAQLNPSNPKVQNILGLTLGARGQRGPAETAFRKAIQLDPGFADAHLNLAVVYATQQPPLLELARWHYQKALATGHPANPKVEALLDPARAAPPATP